MSQKIGLFYIKQMVVFEDCKSATDDNMFLIKVIRALTPLDQGFLLQYSQFRKLSDTFELGNNTRTKHLSEWYLRLISILKVYMQPLTKLTNKFWHQKSQPVSDSWNLVGGETKITSRTWKGLRFS